MFNTATGDPTDVRRQEYGSFKSCYRNKLRTECITVDVNRFFLKSCLKILLLEAAFPTMCVDTVLRLLSQSGPTHYLRLKLRLGMKQITFLEKEQALKSLAFLQGILGFQRISQCAF
jgi:hypothetical protein